MIGGIVIGVTRRPSEGEIAHLHVERPESGVTVDIRVVERRIDDGTPVKVVLGDEVRWDPKKTIALWSPQGRSSGKQWTDWDIRLRRLGATPSDT